MRPFRKRELARLQAGSLSLEARQCWSNDFEGDNLYLEASRWLILFLSTFLNKIRATGQARTSVERGLFSAGTSAEDFPLSAGPDLDMGIILVLPASIVSQQMQRN